MTALLVLLVTLPSTKVQACAFDLDCAIGSACLKRPGQIYGVCAGGLSPGNSHDTRPNPDPNPMDLDGTAGNTCTFDLDCGIGSRCAKTPPNILGVCISRR